MPGGMSVEEDVLASDIWNLGAILYEIITGKLLLKGHPDKIRTTLICEKIEPDIPINDDREQAAVKDYSRNVKRRTLKTALQSSKCYTR